MVATILLAGRWIGAHCESLCAGTVLMQPLRLVPSGARTDEKRKVLALRNGTVGR